MDLAVFAPTELVAVVRALRDVARTNEVLSGSEADFIAAIAAMHDMTVDPSSLASITPEELARIVTDPHKRKRVIQLLIVIALVDGEGNAAAAEDLLTTYAQALGEDDRGLTVLREVASGHLMLVRFDMLRRIRPILFRGDVLGSLGSMALASIAGEDRSTAERYRALATYPEGTLGRVLFDGWREHGFPIPGEKGGLPERGVFHDVGHVLSGYGVDPPGEIRQAAFQAGFIRTEGFAFLLFAILQFHLGIRITPIAKGERGHFDAKAVLRAAQRGAACTVDLSNPEEWDFWSVAHVPVDELRDRYGVPAP